MKYNAYFANHFGSCRLLCEGHDQHRNRDVKVHAIPGEFDVVGITDGVDCWIAPVNVPSSRLLTTAGAMLVRIRNGEDVRSTQVRRTLVEDPVITVPEKIAARAVLVRSDDTPTPRVKLNV